jgi:hypothetical protein
MVTTASQWREGRRKEIALPSGLTVIIRKLRQRDFVPSGMVGLMVDAKSEDDAQRATDQYLRDHPEEVLAQQDQLLVRGVVSPKFTLDETDATAIYVGDIDEADQQALVAAITEFSGLSVERLAEIDKFRSGALDAPRADGEVLPAAAERPVGSPV